VTNSGAELKAKGRIGDQVKDLSNFGHSKRKSYKVEEILSRRSTYLRWMSFRQEQAPVPPCPCEQAPMAADDHEAICGWKEEHYLIDEQQSVDPWAPNEAAQEGMLALNTGTRERLDVQNLFGCQGIQAVPVACSAVRNSKERLTLDEAL
jgi:hypothetical protein